MKTFVVILFLINLFGLVVSAVYGKMPSPWVITGAISALAYLVLFKDESCTQGNFTPYFL